MMKLHSSSRQKPVPKSASIPRLGPSFPVTPSFIEGVNFTELIGTTISLKSRACPAGDGGGIVELGRAVWAAAMCETHEHAIKIRAVPRKIIRHHKDFQRVGSNVLHALLHGEWLLNTKDLVVFESAGLTRTEQKHVHFGNYVSKRQTV